MNVLSLNGLGRKKTRFQSVESLEKSFEKRLDESKVVNVDINLEYPFQLNKKNWDIIILNSTFLSKFTNLSRFNQIREKFSWLASSSAYKVALPQDDYDCSSRLDEFFCDFNVDKVITVCPKHWNVLYPNYSKKGNIVLGYTYYISPEDIKRFTYVKPTIHRDIDIFYRATRLPANFGSIGMMKTELPENFKKNVQAKSNLNIDIETLPEKKITGHLWEAALKNAKLCMATTSGSSIHDPYGSVRKKVFEFEIGRPGLSFNEIKKALMLNEDRKYIFSALSPRNFEAALSETFQIGNFSELSNFLEPEEDYIHIEEDLSNLENVLEFIDDVGWIQKSAIRFKEKILSIKAYRIESLMQSILEDAHPLKKASSQDEDIDNLIRKIKTFDKIQYSLLELYSSIRDFIVRAFQLRAIKKMIMRLTR